MRYRDKDKTVALCLLQLEELELIEHMCISLDIATAWNIVTYYIINHRDLVIGIQLKTLFEIK